MKRIRHNWKKGWVAEPDWLAYIGGQVVGRAALPLQAVRTAEAALGTG